MNEFVLTGESPGIVRDSAGVPVDWQLFAPGDTAITQEGKDGTIRLTPEDIQAILDYHAKKGEQIPIDSEHFLYQLAQEKGLDESDALRLFPGGVAALGFGNLYAGKDGELRIKVQWTPDALKMLPAKLYKYFSPVLRGLEKPPLRVTSVAMTNTPAINRLDALAARAEQHTPTTGRKEPMSTKLEKALSRLCGRDSVALSEGQEKDKDNLAMEVEEKANLIEQVRKLLGLPDDATVEAILAALKAESEKAASADKKQEQLDELAASAEKQEHARLVAKGRAERKIVDADMEYVNGLDSAALAAYLDHAAPKYPARSAVTPAHADTDGIALSAEDRTACRRLNISEETFLAAKKERMTK